ncbi:MAG: aminopeptidase N [Betaproteobacteria bacterium RIFCSPLOWO2_12_FULL_63_13]|nr:MAG: aminopeptidase N [Betaproteobacteria bacterium RIFCSPLOWO2_12_FULL_63_13]
MRDPTPQTIYLKDYRSPAFLVSAVDLDFELHEDHAQVRSRLSMQRNPESADPRAPLALDGEDLELVSVCLDGRALCSAEIALDTVGLTIQGGVKLPRAFTLETVARIYPRRNTKLMGLYGSRDGFFTQCEAQGFRRITWFPDRPDVMARYAVTIHADREKYPLLLSNGNRVASGGGRGGRHWVRWEDPFPKPCYLFAMVAARLDALEDSIVTRSGRTAKLAVYVEPGKLDQSVFAMQALKKAIKWDEEVFGLELDLERYMIVSVGDFNMGAMENKGLNIFNTKYVLARPDTATDTDFLNIDRVVAHEYFHNWTGNRVTCRDWFQLSLKEGLTVFRDQEFGADMYSRPVQRIQEVRRLRAAQFPEDAGPMAHPVRPASYMEISNFYTATVYEKGAEVVRMIHTLIGAEAFRKGMDLYFARHDGQAVTCEQFVDAMADASGTDLSQFKRWYEQAGTPVLEVRDTYDAQDERYTLEVTQSCPPTPGQAAKLPFHIPLSLGLLNADGNDIPLRLQGESAAGGGSRVLSVTETESRFTFVDVREKPVPSLVRGFSAPVIVKYDCDEAALVHLMAHDTDCFNRWEAGQRLASDLILRGAQALQNHRAIEVPKTFVAAFARLLAEAAADPAFAAEALSLPSETTLAEQMGVVDPDALHEARVQVRTQLAWDLQPELLDTWRAHRSTGPYSPDAEAAGARALRNLALGYLMELDDPEMRSLALMQFEHADNMTDAMAALAALAGCDCRERQIALDAFYAKWKDEPLVVDKWLAVQAASRLPGTLDEVKRLSAHPAFNLRNPNKVYSLLFGFCANHVRFHSADGGGYAFAADRVIELDAMNPQVAARMARAFDRWRKFDDARQAKARAALERIRDTAGLSRDTSEVVTKALT